jgi:hypothetical protein
MQGFDDRRRQAGKQAGPARPHHFPDLARRGQVETYSGSRLHESPRRFRLGEAWLEVGEILARWRRPGDLGFKVRASDGRLYLLTYRPETDTWEVRPAKSAQEAVKSGSP